MFCVDRPNRAKTAITSVPLASSVVIALSNVDR